MEGSMGILAWIVGVVIMNTSITPVIQKGTIAVSGLFHQSSCQEIRDASALQQNNHYRAVQCKGKDGKTKSIFVN